MTERALLDTSAIIDLPQLRSDDLPKSLAISAVTLAELAAGPHAAANAAERAVRQQRLQWAEATFDALPFDSEAARAYGYVYALIRAQGQSRSRVADLLIAATAMANQLPLVTRNPADLAGLDDVVEIISA